MDTVHIKYISKSFPFTRIYMKIGFDLNDPSKIETDNNIPDVLTIRTVVIWAVQEMLPSHFFLLSYSHWYLPGYLTAFEIIFKGKAHHQSSPVICIEKCSESHKSLFHRP